MNRLVVFCLILVFLFFGTCLADGYDLANMTTEQLTQLKNDINKQLDADHKVTSSEESCIDSAVKSYVEDYYGSDNVSWAWFDYSYTKEWDYFTLSTHADVKKGNEKTRCDIFADIFRSNDEYQIVYLTVGNDELIDTRNESIVDQRVRTMLGLSDNANVSSTPTTDIDAEASPDDNNTTEPEFTDAPVIAQRGDRNDTVKEIQTMLIRLGYLSGNADGDFGKKTESAIISFQHDNGLEQTGIITEDVYNAIKNACESIPEPVTYAKYTAKEVYSKYESNEIAGDSAYKGKTIEVTGKIDEVGTSMFGTPYVYLKADSYGFNLLHFEFSKNDLDRLATLKEDQTITIRAKCTGWSIMFVYFEDSEIVQ